MMGYTPVFGAGEVRAAGRQESAFPGLVYCVGEARHRLIWSGTLLAVGLAIVTVGVYLLRRRRPPSIVEGSER